MWGWLDGVQIPWIALALTLGGLVAVLFLRRLLPEGNRRRGLVPIVLLLISLVVRIAVTVVVNLAPAAAPVSSFLGFLAALFMAFGLTGLAALLVFDVGLGRLRVPVPSLVRDILQAVVLAVVLFEVLHASGVNVLSLVTTSAVLTAVIGLALQTTIANLFAGLSLQIDRTIGVGDWIHVGQRVGRVTQIKWRSTFLVTRDGDNVILPNAMLVSTEVLNYSKPTIAHRISLKVGFAYRHPPNDVKRMLVNATQGVARVLRDPPPDCFPVDFGDNSVTYALRYWVDDVAHEPEVDGEIRTRIWYAAQRTGMEIPFPSRNVFLTELTHEKAARDEEREFLERVAALARIDLFGPLEDADRELLARAMRRVSFAVGEDIIRQGDPGDSLYLIHEGEVAVRLVVESAERQLATLRRGDFFGEMSLMTGEPRRATCSARADTACWVIGHTALQDVLARRPKVAEDISLILQRRSWNLEGEQRSMAQDAAARRAAQGASPLLSRIREFFHLS